MKKGGAISVLLYARPFVISLDHAQYNLITNRRITQFSDLYH